MTEPEEPQVSHAEQLVADGTLTQLALANLSLAPMTPGAELPPGAEPQVALMLTGTVAWRPGQPVLITTQVSADVAEQIVPALQEAIATARAGVAPASGLITASPGDVAGVAAAAGATEQLRGASS